MNGPVDFRSPVRAGMMAVHSLNASTPSQLAGTFSPMADYLNAAALLELAQRVEHLATAPCVCTRTPLEGWQSQPLSLDDAQFVEIGTLLPPDDPEPAFTEYLPGKTTYWGADAPIAPRYFPYNRCGVWQCSLCRRLYLRYTEGGGYFVDKRIRALQSALIEDVPL